MLRFDLLIFGDAGWGDELIISAIMTILVSLSSMGLGIFVAIFVTWIKISGNTILKILASIYTTVIRGIPELLVIYLIFFGGSSSIMYLAKIFGYNGYIELNAFTMGTLSIGLISAAYSSEVFRGAYSALNRGQLEAAKSLGLSKFNTFKTVLAPQILKYALPGLGNVWQITLKDTALVSVTGLVEIMRQTRIASNVTHSPLTFVLSAAILYLILTTFSSKIFNKIEDYTNKDKEPSL